MMETEIGRDMLKDFDATALLAIRDAALYRAKLVKRYAPADAPIARMHDAGKLQALADAINTLYAG